MKIKTQFIFLSSLIILIPILGAVFVILHTYMHSPNRYLMKGSVDIVNQNISLLSDDDEKKLELSLKMLPKEVEALVWRSSDKKVFYSTMPEIKVGTSMQRDKIWNFAEKTSSEYFYQVSKIRPISSDALLITRLPRNLVNTEQQTKHFLRILAIIILLAISSFVIILFISKTIFTGLNKIQFSSAHLAEGNFSEPIVIHTSNKDNEFNCILNSLETMRCELQEIQERKNRFIMGISHDLRTPVSVIKGYSEAVQDNVITEKDEIKKTIELIEQKASQLEGMIDTLINFMKLNNTEMKEQLVSNSVTKLIKDFAKYAEVTGTIFKRKVTTDINIGKEIKIPLNTLLVQRSFENLFSNAIRYTKENDLIEISAFLSNDEDNNFIVFKIKDSGCGIDKKDLDYIFDLFYRGTNSRQEEGMGIGLAVVKNIMKTHGWDISVESQKGNGSCFTIKIPY